MSRSIPTLIGTTTSDVTFDNARYYNAGRRDLGSSLCFINIKVRNYNTLMVKLRFEFF